jgi:transcriptional regulator with XRE-family HTH domain
VAADQLVWLGARMRAHRKALGWNQEELAHRAAVDRSYVGGVERGERNITFLMLSRLSAALGLTVSELTEGLPARRDDGT